MNALDISRTIVVLIWSAVLFFRFESILAVLLKPQKATQFDVFWALHGLTAIMVIGFALRFYLAENSDSVFVGLYIFCGIVGLFKLAVVHGYKKVQDAPAPTDEEPSS